MKKTSFKFNDCIENSIKNKKKIKQKDYLDEGLFPIISQEEALINGYTNEESYVVKINKPIIIYGDHTQIIKYIDFDFAIGADGVKIFETKENILPKFFYYLLKNTYIKSRGYARHSPYLIDKEFQIPDSISEQKNIVRRIENALIKTNSINELLEENKKLLAELELSLIRENINA